jgi:hypothetical protein
VLFLADISQGEVLVLDYDAAEGTGRVWALWDENGNGYSKHDERANLLEYPGLRFGLGTHSGCECGVFRLHAHARTHEVCDLRGRARKRGVPCGTRGGEGGRGGGAAPADRETRWPTRPVRRDIGPGAALALRRCLRGCAEPGGRPGTIHTPFPLLPRGRPLG